MRIDILSLFPESFAPLEESIVKRAVNKGVVELHVSNIRDYTTDKHHLTDDKLYGGGAGMVMKPEPVFAAVNAVKNAEKPRIIFTAPCGRQYDQRMAEELATEDQLIIVCGHYEGIDERIIELLATDVISIGDFVLTGGELPAMIIADSVIRLLPGALGDDASSQEESFTENLLEYPQYTRPAEFMGISVPEVLSSGDHRKIAAWRRKQSIERTLRFRPDLLEKASLTYDDTVQLEALNAAKQKTFHAFVALVHYPVYNKKQQIINTSVTNLDVHDIARAAHSFGLEGYFIVQPVQGQQNLFNDLLDYWHHGYGASYNSDRTEALASVAIVDSIEQAILQIKKQTGELPKLIGTSAKASEKMHGFCEMREIIENEGGSYLLLLGTGWGLCHEVMARCDYILRPIYGKGAYNHLSVRSAASIIFDRLFGEKNSRMH